MADATNKKYKIKYNEKSKQNLKYNYLNEREDFKELSAKGGIMGAKKKQEFRHAKDLLTDILSKDLTKEEVTKILGEDIPNRNTYNVMLTKMVQIANKGNVKAFESLRDTVGDKPIDKVQADVTNTITDKDRELLEILARNIVK